MIKKLREQILRMAYGAQEGHIPSALSILDILWVLYDKIMKPEDKFILSKGHGCLALYVILAEKGIIPKETLNTFGMYYSILGGHPDMNKVPGVEASTGSLGHGLPIAVGIAMARKIKKEDGHIFCLIGDGECNEGSIWESIMIASHHNLDNLICIVDYNHSTDRALSLGNLGKKFQSFGWRVYDVLGHDHKMLEHLLTPTLLPNPTVVICNTVKGWGIERMQNNPAWHHRSPNEKEFKEIIDEITVC
jgi:transketolase